MLGLKHSHKMDGLFPGRHSCNHGFHLPGPYGRLRFVQDKQGEHMFPSHSSHLLHSCQEYGHHHLHLGKYRFQKDHTVYRRLKCHYSCHLRRKQIRHCHSEDRLQLKYCNRLYQYIHLHCNQKIYSRRSCFVCIGRCN